MKNTLLITKFFPPERGGIQSYLYNLVLNLPKEKIFVFTQRPDEASASSKAKLRLAASFPFKVFYANFESPLRYLHLTAFDLFFKIRKILKQEGIEKILCGHLPIAGPLAFLIKKTYGIPYLVFTHGMEIFSIKNLSRQKQKMFIKIMCEAEKIIVTADFMADYLKKEFDAPFERIIKIPPGVDYNFFRPMTKSDKAIISFRTKLGVLDFNKKIILTSGRLVARKNHISVIRALPLLIKAAFDISYLISGTGPEEKNLREVVKRLGLQNCVKFLGDVRREDLPLLYNLSDVFIMPSREIKKTGDIEGFGLVFLEAAACAKPCIAGKSGGQREAILEGRTGYLVDPQSIDEIAAAILKIFKNPDLARDLGLKGRSRVIEEFDWQKQANKLKRLLE